MDENALHQRLSTILNCIKYGDYDDLNIVNHLHKFLFTEDSERSDECIDFTMLCVFLCLCIRERVELMLQFQTLGVSDRKMNLVGALGRSFFEFPNSFQKRRENQKKIKEKREFLRKTSFQQI
ncbi:Uncharacterized protein FWK35_00031388, partial [Aphis craccivora]